MIDREKLETVLERRFPGATVQQIAAAANAIIGLEDEWEETAAQIRFGALGRGSSRAATQARPGGTKRLRAVAE
jgi:hypothetical protein